MFCEHTAILAGKSVKGWRAGAGLKKSGFGSGLAVSKLYPKARRRDIRG
jgi:hypothetical protein